jgi:hypothetical protein
MPRPSPIDLPPKQALTQYGTRGPTPEGVRVFFRNRPNPRAPERGMSLLAGQLAPYEAAMTVRQEWVPRRDGVRWTTVEQLTAAGFVVRSTPNRMNPRHVSVEHEGEWTDDVAKRFDDCFGQPWGRW